MDAPRGRLERLSMEPSGSRPLIVAPHLDDEWVGPGRLAVLQQQHGAAAVIVTDGTRGAGGGSEPGLVQQRILTRIAPWT